jgi:hypothetical protein
MSYCSKGGEYCCTLEACAVCNEMMQFSTALVTESQSPSSSAKARRAVILFEMRKLQYEGADEVRTDEDKTTRGPKVDTD